MNNGTADPSVCPECGRENCEEHLLAPAPLKSSAPSTLCFPDEELEDATLVAAEGRELHTQGVKYVVHELIPNYGTCGFVVAYNKVGKTTWGLQLGAHVASGRPFLNRQTEKTRVLVLSAEDPPEYIAWLARHLDVPPGCMFIRRKPLILTPANLRRICATVRQKQIGLVLLCTWQSVITGLIKDENDNAGAVAIVERVKQATRETGIPWLIDAHSGKGEDQSDDADPSRAMRGASAAAGAADYTLSLRYAKGTFSTLRRLSGKGRFVSLAPTLLDFDPLTSAYTTTQDDQKSVMRETTWALIRTTGALTIIPATLKEIGVACGLVGADRQPTSQQRRQLLDALTNRPEVGRNDVLRRGKKVTVYFLLS